MWSKEQCLQVLSCTTIIRLKIISDVEMAHWPQSLDDCGISRCKIAALCILAIESSTAVLPDFFLFTYATIIHQIETKQVYLLHFLTTFCLRCPHYWSQNPVLHMVGWNIALHGCQAYKMLVILLQKANEIFWGEKIRYQTVPGDIFNLLVILHFSIHNAIQLKRSCSSRLRNVPFC